MSTTHLPVAVYTPRTLAVRPHHPAVALGSGALEMTVRTDSLGLDTLDEPTIQARTSPLAVAAAVCAVLGFLHAAGFFGGIILGHIALRMIRRSKGSLRGRRLARAALLISWTPLALVAAVFVLMTLLGLHITVNGG